MPTLSVTISDFTGDFASNNGAKSIALTQEKVLHAAFTVGTPLLKKGTPGADHALAMAAYKGIAMMATMDFSRAALSCFPEYKKLDPSEKNNLSYWIGMVITALSAREFLKVDQLLHAACFHLNSITLTDIESKSLADLVGHDGDTHWHVLEAKGRQNKPSDLEKYFFSHLKDLFKDEPFELRILFDSVIELSRGRGERRLIVEAILRNLDIFDAET